MNTRQPIAHSRLFPETFKDTFKQAGTPARLNRTARQACPELPRPGSTRRVLVLTSGLGSGHARAAEAIQQAWHAVDPQAAVHTLDFWSLMDPDVAEAIQQGYLRLVTEHPALYERAYRLDQRSWRSLLAGGAVPEPLQSVLRTFPKNAFQAPPRRKGNRTDRWMFLALLAAFKGRTWGWPGGILRSGLLSFACLRLMLRLRVRIREFRPEVIVVNQIWPAVLLSPLKISGAVAVPVVGVLTDFGVHALWEQPGIDHYCVASADMVAPLRAAGVKDSRIWVTGIPLMPGFHHQPSMTEARQALGLEPLRAVVLLLGGGLGLGLEAVAKQVLAIGTEAQLLVVAGRNRAVLKSLAPLTAASPLVRVYPWTECMELFMRAADVVVGKPGGLTVAEAMACGRPLVATRALRGQEGFNVHFLEAHGVGCLAPEEALGATVAALLANRQQLARMQERIWKLGRRDSAERVGGIATALAKAHAVKHCMLKPWWQRLAHCIFRRYDAVYRRLRLRAIGPLLQVGCTRYRGPTRVFSDGTTLRPGDRVGSLHFDNARAAALHQADKPKLAALRFGRLLRTSLQSLAALALTDPDLRELGVYRSISWLRPHGRQFGFVVEPLDDGGLRSRLRRTHFRFILRAFLPGQSLAAPTPHVFWLTRCQLLEHFGDREQNEPA